MRGWQKRSRLWRVSSGFVFGVTLAYGLLCLFVRVQERIARSRSEELYAEFMSIRPELTSKSDVERFYKEWAGRLREEVDCSGEECNYRIGDIWGWSRWTMLTRFAHDHAPSSMLELETKGNYLLRASFAARVMVPKGYGTREEQKSLSDAKYVPYSSGEYALIGRVSLAAVLPELCCGGIFPIPARGYRAIRVHCINCLETRVTALPSVAPEVKSRLFRFDFDCMTRWKVCTDKEDLAPGPAEEELRDTTSSDDEEDLRHGCRYTAEELAPAASNAAEIRISDELPKDGSVKGQVLRYFGGTHTLQAGKDVRLSISRVSDPTAFLREAHASSNKVVVLYGAFSSDGIIYPYDQCGLLPDSASEAVVQHFELHPK